MTDDFLYSRFKAHEDQLIERLEDVSPGDAVRKLCPLSVLNNQSLNQYIERLLKRAHGVETGTWTANSERVSALLRQSDQKDIVGHLRQLIHFLSSVSPKLALPALKAFRAELPHARNLVRILRGWVLVELGMYSEAHDAFRDVKRDDLFGEPELFAQNHALEALCLWEEQADLLIKLEASGQLAGGAHYLRLRYIESLYDMGRFEDLAGKRFSESFVGTEVLNWALQPEFYIACTSGNTARLEELRAIALQNAASFDARDREKLDWACLFAGLGQIFGTFEAADVLRIPELDAVFHNHGNGACLVCFDTMTQFSLGHIHRDIVSVCKRMGVSVLAIRDIHGNAGNAGFGAAYGSPEKSAAVLIAFLDAYNFRTTHTLGISGSGLSAVYFGGAIGAKGVIGFGCRTYVPEMNVIEKLFNVSTVWRYNERLKIAPSAVIRDVRNIVAVSGDMYIENHVGAQSAYDNLYAKEFRTGSNTAIFTYDHARHSSEIQLKAAGLLEDRLTQFLRRSDERLPEPV